MNKKKKSIIGFTVFCVLIVGTIVYLNIPKSLSAFYDTDEPIDKVYLMSGNTGDSVVLNQEQQLKIQDYLDKIKVRRNFFKEPSGGWVYRVQIMQGDKCLDIVFAGENCDVNGKNYLVKDEEIVSEFLQYCRTIVQ